MARSMAIRVVLMSLLAALLAFARPADAADLAVETNRPVATSDLRVIVRSTGYVDALRKHAAERLEPQPIVRPLAGDLWLLCVGAPPRPIKKQARPDGPKHRPSPEEAVALGKQAAQAGP